MRVAGLLGANALIVCIGLGLLPWLGAARSWRETDHAFVAKHQRYSREGRLYV